MVKYQVWYLNDLLETFDDIGEAEEYINVCLEKWHINLFRIVEVNNGI
jgi:hypothetical protein